MVIDSYNGDNVNNDKSNNNNDNNITTIKENECDYLSSI